MRLLYELIYLVLLITIVDCRNEEKEGLVYCRVCGSVIANVSHITMKEAEERDYNKELENQEGNAHIHYDSFESSVSHYYSYSNRIESMERKEVSVFLSS